MWPCLRILDGPKLAQVQSRGRISTQNHNWRRTHMTTQFASFRALRLGLVSLAATLFLSVQLKSAQQGNGASLGQSTAGQSSATSSQRQFIDRYCVTCHSDRLKTGGLSLEGVDVSRPGEHPEIWEKV